MDKNIIHIVVFDVIFPVNYGGVIDVFSRILYWKKLGYSIILHCYEYGRGKHSEIEKYCEKVYYYERKKRIIDIFSSKPFIVKTRINKLLIERLNKDQYPIWLEGLHCAWVLNFVNAEKRKIFVRVHNIEHDYYSSLVSCTRGLKQWFYRLEAFKLKYYESILSKADALYVISYDDFKYFKTININTYYLPSLPTFEGASRKEFPEALPYILYQGSLDVEENENAVVWLIDNVLKFYPKMTKIAGKNATNNIRKHCKNYGIQLIENPDEEEMKSLIQRAKIHILYTEQATGLKLKLINVLSSNGEIIANKKILDGTDWEQYCWLANTGKQFCKYIDEILKKTNIGNEKITNRHKKLKELVKYTEKTLSEIF